MTTIDFEPLTVTVPLREEPPGVFRVGKSRVTITNTGTRAGTE